MVQRDSRSQFVVAIVKRYAAFEDPLDHRADVGSLERKPGDSVAHMATRAKRHFAILHVVARCWKLIQAAGMVVMHMRDDYIPHLRRLDADHLESFGRRSQQLALAF